MRKRSKAALAAVAVAALAAGGAAVGGTSHAATWACTSTNANTNCPTSGDWSGQLNAVPADPGHRQQIAVLQNEFGNSANQAQELDANSASQWQVVAKVAAGNTSVTSYPDTQDQLDTYDGSRTPAVLPQPVSEYTSLTSTFAVSLPASPGSTDDWEAAYDLWLGSMSQPSYTNDQEIMVWNDNHGQTPAGSDSGKTWTDSSTGAVYEIWTWGGSNTVSPTYQTITFLAKSNVTSGSLDVLAMLKFLENNGYATANLGIDQVDYGFEICSTSGLSETFAVNGFTLDGAVTGGPTPTPTPTGTPTPTPTPTPTAPPANLSQTAHVLVNFGWTPEDGAPSYEFQLQLNNGAVVDDETVPTAHVSLLEVTKDTGYKWRVRVTGGQWSGLKGFTAP